MHLPNQFTSMQGGSNQFGGNTRGKVTVQPEIKSDSSQKNRLLCTLWMYFGNVWYWLLRKKIVKLLAEL